MNSGLPPKCETCGDMKWVVLDHDNPKHRAVRCKCVMNKKPETVEKRLSMAGLSDEEVKLTTLPVDEQVKGKLKKATEYADDGLPDNLLIVGDVGRGKTLFGLRLLKHIASAKPDWPLRYVYMPKLLLNIKATFESGNSSDTEQAIIEQLTKAKLLMLDDLGAEHATPWACSILSLVIHERGRQKKPTVVTSNFEVDLPEQMGFSDDDRPQTLRELYDDRVASRLKPFKKVVLSGCDLREKYRG
ncbi:hypothetical protein LCGC14_1458710 [marine sediment metagenome]|uniref:Uncharacterized protein n=1 Tax=marine sediment metagenome TaxID=412755 RepID=A0A0F9JGC5_9ZZZZ